MQKKQGKRKKEASKRKRGQAKRKGDKNTAEKRCTHAKLTIEKSESALFLYSK